MVFCSFYSRNLLLHEMGEEEVVCPQLMPESSKPGSSWLQLNSWDFFVFCVSNNTHVCVQITSIPSVAIHCFSSVLFKAVTDKLSIPKGKALFKPQITFHLKVCQGYFPKYSYLNKNAK